MRGLRRALRLLIFGAIACGKPNSEGETSERTPSPSATSSAVAEGIATAKRAAEARAAAPEECVGCSSRLAVDGAPGGTCRNNGPPSSHDLLIRWGKCLCQPSACASSCGICGSGAEQITAACLACGKRNCPTEYAACAADIGPAAGSTGNATEGD